MADYSVGGIGAPQLAVHKTLFVGNLSYFCAESHLYSLFSNYGGVESVEIKRGRDTGDCLMHGFVEMVTFEAAELAANDLKGKKFMGRRIRVSRGNGRSIDNERDSWVQLHVSFVSRQVEVVISEEVMDAAFSTFGEVTDCVVKRHRVTQESQSQSGYGFVYFDNLDIAVRTLYLMKHTTVNGVTYDCNVSYKSEQMVNSHMQYLIDQGQLPPPQNVPANIPKPPSFSSTPSPTSMYRPIYPQAHFPPPNNVMYDPSQGVTLSPPMVQVSPRFNQTNIQSPPMNYGIPQPTMIPGMHIQTMHNPYQSPQNSYTIYPPTVATSNPYSPMQTVTTISSHSPYYNTLSPLTNTPPDTMNMSPTELAYGQVTFMNKPNMMQQLNPQQQAQQQAYVSPRLVYQSMVRNSPNTNVFQRQQHNPNVNNNNNNMNNNMNNRMAPPPLQQQQQLQQQMPQQMQQHMQPPPQQPQQLPPQLQQPSARGPSSNDMNQQL